MSASFLFTTCQLGAEPTVKQDVTSWRPDLRFAFSRPGFITFKSTGQPIPLDLVVESVFARAFGASLGKASTAAEVAALAAQLPGQAALRLHVFERDIAKPGEEPDTFQYGTAPARLIPALEAALTAAGFKLLPSNAAAQVGDRVLDVVTGLPEEPWWVGAHEHTARHHPFPGGRTPVDAPPESPSRAFGKMEEALAWNRAPVRQGDNAVELGSGPGGATLALLRRGVSVWGVDPGAMDARVMAFAGPGGARCIHIPRVMGQVERKELPPQLHWVVADVNAAPQVVLGTVERMCGQPRDALLGVLLTLKMDHWKAARHAAGWLERVRKMGMEDVRATQLAGNRLEFHVCGLTQAGVERRSRV